MIRFSAALVVVAIGVLIGGIATSKLVLVYIAIVLSAVALVALAIGVILKREQFFGEGQGLASAQAGASPVLPARAGESNDHSRLNGSVAPPPLQGAAVGPGAAFAGRQGASPPAGQVPPGRAQPGEAWETQAGRGSWPSPATAAPAPAASGATTAVGWGAPTGGEAKATGDPAVTGGGTAPRPLGPLSAGTASAGTVAPSAFAPRPADTSPGAAPPSWFNLPVKAEPAPASGTDGGWSWLNSDTAVPADNTVPADSPVPRDNSLPEDKGKPEDAAALDEDDDWPARYSWLDEEPEDAAATIGGQPAEDGAAAPDAALGGDSPVSADAVPEATAAKDAVAHETEPATSAMLGLASDTEPEADEAGGAEAPGGNTEEQPALHLVRDPDLESEGAGIASEPGDEPPSAPAGGPAGLVTVVRGVPRYHKEDCVLIRFMPPSDTQQLSVALARAAGCTPCTACEPEG